MEAATTLKPILVGEVNPYTWSDEYHDLYPAPEHSAGWRLCCVILGMDRKAYIEQFDRINLCRGTWRLAEAKKKTAELIAQERPKILLGSKVCNAFDRHFDPFQIDVYGNLVLPHPSGRCRLWFAAGAVERARVAVRRFLPELAPLIGWRHEYA
jgi:hypothetical protein